jgi:hypothetical protein
MPQDVMTVALACLGSWTLDAGQTFSGGTETTMKACNGMHTFQRLQALIKEIL